MRAAGTDEHRLALVEIELGRIAPCDLGPEAVVGSALRDVWESLRDVTIALLERQTFADLAQSAGGRWLDPAADLPDIPPKAETPPPPGCRGGS